MRCQSACGPMLLIAALALASAGCCCCQDGYVLHGAWSLRLTPTPCPAQPGCGQCCPGGCGEGCAQSRCPVSNRSSLHRIPGQGSGVCADGPRCKKCGNCRLHCRCKGRGGDNTAGSNGPHNGHPRFHPVPVRPVFGPVITQLPVPTAQPEPADPFANEPEDIGPPEPILPNNVRRSVPIRRATVQQAAGYSWPQAE